MATQPISNDHEWVTIQQAAEIIGVHANTVRNLINSGKLKASRIGLRLVRIERRDLDALFTPVVGGDYSVWNR